MAAGDGARCLQEAAEVVAHCLLLEEVVEEDAEAYLQAGVADPVDIGHSHHEAGAALGGAIACLLENVLPYHRGDAVPIVPHCPHGDEVSRFLLEGAAGVIARSRYPLLEVDAEVAEVTHSLQPEGVGEIAIFHSHQDAVVVDDVMTVLSY